MDKMAFVMDKLTILNNPPEHFIRTRTPLDRERTLGAWIDRSGDVTKEKPFKDRMRIFGQYNIIQVMEGTADFFTAPSGWHELHPGDCAIIFPEIPHHYDAGPEGWRHCYVAFAGPMADKLRKLGYLDPARPIVHEPEMAVWKTHQAYIRRRLINTPEMILRRYHQLINLMYHYYACRGQQEPGGRQSEKLEEIIDFINDHYEETIKPADLARRFRMSYSHLRHIFRRETGMSIQAFLTERRIEAAKNILSEGRLSIKETAREIGYDDVYYFMRLFRRHTGMTAAQFRSQSA